MRHNEPYTIAVRHVECNMFYRSSRWNGQHHEALEYVAEITEKYSELESAICMTREYEAACLIPNDDTRVIYSGRKHEMLPLVEMDVLGLAYFMAGPKATSVERLFMAIMGIDPDDRDKLMAMRAHGELCKLSEHTPCVEAIVKMGAA